MHKWLLSSSKTVTTAIHTWEILTMNQTIFLINTIIINYINHELLHIHCCSLLKFLQPVLHCKEITQPYM